MSVAFFARIPKVVEFEKLVLRALAELPDKKRVYISQSTFQRYRALISLILKIK